MKMFDNGNSYSDSCELCEIVTNLKCNSGGSRIFLLAGGGHHHLELTRSSLPDGGGGGKFTSRQYKLTSKKGHHFLQRGPEAQPVTNA